MVKTLYIVRHGETDLNKKGIVQGRGIDSNLNATGLIQSEKFYAKYCNVPFDKLYTSTLKRTHETMSLFIQNGLPWEQLSGLDEMGWGIYEGAEPTSETRAQFKKLTTCWESGDLKAHFEGGESPLDVNLRQKEALNYIMSHSDEKIVLIAMHGRALRMFLCLLLNEPLSKMDQYPHNNLSLYKIGFEGNSFKISAFNNIDHLKII